MTGYETTASSGPGSDNLPLWKTAVAAKQVQLEAALPAEWRLPAPLKASIDLSLTSTTDLTKPSIVRESGIMSEYEVEITEKYSATQLLEKLANREMTSVEVTVAFSKRAAIAQQLLSCLTEMFFDLAQERARFLDDYIQTEGKVYGPLHGLPISLKDSFNVVGIQSTIGYVSFLGRPIPTTNAALVELLLDLGAIFYVKTNIPQTLMTADSENNIFGRTRNPRKLNLTAGGSSGGEGALAAFRGSILGVGTDIAGSIRIPSLCCGIYGFKPTSNRIPYGGQTSPSLPGLPGIVPAAGPMGRSVADLKLFFKSVLDANPWMKDSKAYAAPYSAPPRTQKPLLTIGILPEDPLALWHPPVRRAVDNAVSALASAGHNIVHIPPSAPTSASKAWDLAQKYFVMDPKKTGFQNLRDSEEPMVKSLAATLPPGVDLFTLPALSLLDVAAMNVEREIYQEGWREIFVHNTLDIVIGPAAQHTAPKHDTYGMPGYTAMWNLLDYPACIIPYGEASMALDPDDSANPSIKNPPYDAAAFDGAPTVIQVVAPRFQDELCLEAAEIIDGALKSHHK